MDRRSLRDDVLVGGIAEETIKLFAEKSSDYGESDGVPAALFLGAKGQFADINRKFWKLKRSLWDGQLLVGEQPEEILMDLVGHCWLTIAVLRKESDHD